MEPILAVPTGAFVESTSAPLSTCVGRVKMIADVVTAESTTAATTTEPVSHEVFRCADITRVAIDLVSRSSRFS